MLISRKKFKIDNNKNISGNNQTDSYFIIPENDYKIELKKETKEQQKQVEETVKQIIKEKAQEKVKEMRTIPQEEQEAKPEIGKKLEIFDKPTPEPKKIKKKAKKKPAQTKSSSKP